MSTWVISDVHGCFYTLQKMLEAIRSVDPRRQLVFAGDYTDRGRFSKETVSLIIGLWQDGATCLRGNHDDVFDFLLNTHSESDPRDWVAHEPTTDRILWWWFRNGFSHTMQSYGVKDDCPDMVLSQLRKCVPTAHKDFFRNLPMFWESETHFACHGMMRHNKPLPLSLKFVKPCLFSEILWSRYDKKLLQTPGATAWNKIGIFGHTPTKQYGSDSPFYWDKIRLIDGCTFRSNGYLAAYCTDTDKCIVVPSDLRDVS